jgi:hypothetical protein
MLDKIKLMSNMMRYEENNIAFNSKVNFSELKNASDYFLSTIQLQNVFPFESLSFSDDAVYFVNGKGNSKYRFNCKKNSIGDSNHLLLEKFHEDFFKLFKACSDKFNKIDYTLEQAIKVDISRNIICGADKFYELNKLFEPVTTNLNKFFGIGFIVGNVNIYLTEFLDNDDNFYMADDIEYTSLNRDSKFHGVQNQLLTLNEPQAVYRNPSFIIGLLMPLISDGKDFSYIGETLVINPFEIKVF